MDYSGYSWTAGSRKHRVSRSQARHVVEHAELYFVRPADPPDRPDEALLFVGDDAHGLKLEVVGVELADGRLRVIHAMPMRPGYEPLYQEAHKWRQ
jgi:hypothetical protein